MSVSGEMQCLTILNPFPAYIMLPANDPRHKRVENRTWATSHRGLLLIHAGREPHSSFDPDDEEYAGLNFAWGDIVGAADLVDCVELGHMSLTVGSIKFNNKEIFGGLQTMEQKIVPAAAGKRFPWLVTHRHAEGPICWVLENVRKFRKPIPLVGKQRLFKLPAALKKRVLEELSQATAL